MFFLYSNKQLQYILLTTLPKTFLHDTTGATSPGGKGCMYPAAITWRYAHRLQTKKRKKRAITMGNRTYTERIPKDLPSMIAQTNSFEIECVGLHFCTFGTYLEHRRSDILEVTQKGEILADAMLYFVRFVEFWNRFPYQNNVIIFFAKKHLFNLVENQLYLSFFKFEHLTFASTNILPNCFLTIKAVSNLPNCFFASSVIHRHQINFIDKNSFICRRNILARKMRGNSPALNNLPWEYMDYSKVSTSSPLKFFAGLKHF